MLIADAVTASGDNASRVFAIEALLAPLLAKRRFDVPIPSAAVASLADWLAVQALSPGEAQATLAQLLAERKVTVKDSDITNAVKARVGLRTGPRVLVGDPALMARWSDVAAELERQIGIERTSCWFGQIAIVRIERGVAHLVTHQRFVATHIEREFSSQLRVALDAVFSGIAAVAIATRAPPPPQIADRPFPASDFEPSNRNVARRAAR